MVDTLRTVVRQIVGALRYRWWAMLVTWIVCLIGWAGVLALPDVYASRARIYVDVSSRIDQVMGGVTIARDIESQLIRVRQQLLGRPALEAVATATGLAKGVETREERAALLTALQESIIIRVDGGTESREGRQTDSIFTITYEDEIRERAIAVVEKLLETFVSDVTDGGQTASRAAQEFLVEQIAVYEDMLRQRENALAEFKKEYIGLLPGDTGGYFERLQTRMEELETMRSELRTSEHRLEALRAQLSSENPSLPAGITLTGLTPGLMAAQNPIDASISELENDLAVLLLRFTPQHPDVLAVNEQLDQLYVRRHDAQEALAAAGGSEFEGAVLSTSPVYQSIQMALNQVKVEIAAKEAQIIEHERRIEELQTKVDVIPEVDAKLAQLTRDYDQVKLMNDELVTRLEQERLSTAAEQGDFKFRIIEPPVADFRPVAPDRVLFMWAVLIIGIATGIGVAYLIGQSRAMFVDIRELREFTGLPVLGGVSRVWAFEYRKRWRDAALAYAAAGAALLGVFACVLIFRNEGVALAQSLLAGPSWT